MSERAGNGERSTLYSCDRDANGHQRKLVRCRSREPDTDVPSADNEVYVKLAVVGDANVGKTTLLLRFLHDRFEEKRRVTEGVDCQAIWLKSNHPHYDRRTHVQLIDTAGQERYSAMVPQMLSGAQGIFLVFDATSEESFARVCNYWLDMVQRRNQSCVCMLVATKGDLYAALQGKARWMDRMDMREQAALLNCAGGFHVCSAKVGAHVNAMMIEMIDLAIEHEKKLMQMNPGVADAAGDVLRIGFGAKQRRAKDCAC